jgi:phosphoribosylformimino-5-aminoimidazole carboxamide ribotide isomerase
MNSIRVIPAIDLIDGKCVRLTKGDYATQKNYSDNPVEVAQKFADLGYEYLHVVDLDGAKIGKVKQEKTLEKIIKSTSLKVDFGGGIKTDEDVQKVLNAGASQFTVGSIAVKNQDLVFEWIEKYAAEKIILGADVNDRKIAISGWLETTDLELFSFIETYYEKGIRSVICTDISKDGMLQGPAFELYSEIINRFPSLFLIASGGVSGKSDIEKLENLKIPGVVVGKAFYENKMV